MIDEDPKVLREPDDAASPRDTGLGEGNPEFRFTLYICGATEKSQLAVANARRLCDEHLIGRYSLEIIDLYRHPELAHLRDVFAIPTLVREAPRPHRRLIGDLSDHALLVSRMASLAHMGPEGADHGE